MDAVHWRESFSNKTNSHGLSNPERGFNLSPTWWYLDCILTFRFDLRRVPSFYYMFGFVCACLCEWLLACNLTTAETKTSSLSFPHRQHKTAAGIAPRGQTKLNPSALLGSKGNWSCAVKWSESRWAALRRGRVFGTAHTPTNILSSHALCPCLTIAMRGNLTHRTEYFTYPWDFFFFFFFCMSIWEKPTDNVWTVEATGATC